MAVALGFEPRVAVLHLRPLGHATLPGYSTTRTPRLRKSTTHAGSRATLLSPGSAHPHAQAATRSLPTHHDHHDHHERQAVPARPDSARQRSGSSCGHIQEHPNNTPLSPATPQALTQRSKKQPRACPKPGHPHQHQNPIVKAYLNDTPFIIGSATRLHYAGRVSIQRSERNIRVCATCD